MRVTAAVKAQTERQILDAGRDLFQRRGFGATSTRDIAHRAGIASGTLFNYFDSKEALARAIIDGALDEGVEAYGNGQRTTDSVAEALFALIVRQLHALEGLESAVEGALGSIVGAWDTSAAHVEAAATILARDGADAGWSEMAIRLYRVVHGSIIAFWLRDASPAREDTLAMVDRLTRMLGDARPVDAKEVRDEC